MLYEGEDQAGFNRELEVDNKYAKNVRVKPFPGGAICILTKQGPLSSAVISW